MKKKTFLFASICLLLAILFNLFALAQIRNDRQSLSVKYESPLAGIPEGVVRVSAGEFKGLMADYLMLEVGSFVGSQQKKNASDYRNVYRALKTAMMLDPYFQQSYLIAQGILPAEAGMPIEANELLAIAHEKRFWDWRPAYYMAFNYYYYLDDYAKASELLLEASRREGAPLLLPLLAARFAIKGQRTKATIQFLENMLQEDEEKSPDEKEEIIKRINALKGVWVLETAIETYKSRYGDRPLSLEVLVDEKIIPGIPVNPYGVDFTYDPQKDRVEFD